MNRLLVNAWRCPDGTILESRGVHDCKFYGDWKVGHGWMVDGGLEYCRCGGEGLTFVGCYENDPIQIIRELFTWGTYGPQGNQPKTYVKLRDMSKEHIEAILETQKQIRGTQIESAFKRELEYRKDLNI